MQLHQRNYVSLINQLLPKALACFMQVKAFLCCRDKEKRLYYAIHKFLLLQSQIF